MLRSLIVAISTLAALTPAGANAQTKYPTRPIELIVPFVAGASTDSCARVLAQVLEARWSVPVKVVNKPGGNTVPAVTEVMAAKPDGTTLLVDNIASSAMLDTVVRNLPFKVTDRTFVAMTAYTPMMFIVPADSPIRTLKDAAAAMQTGTETFTWTSLGGVGAQDMVFRRFAAAAGVDVSKTRAVALKGGVKLPAGMSSRAWRCRCAARPRLGSRACERGP
jgi:tripartite-type tricarboxylate transporter receptor subunit TctC